MDFLKKALLSEKLWLSIAALIIAVIFWLVIKKLAKKYIQGNDISGKKATNISYFTTIIKYILIVLLITVILQINGVNVSSLVAGLGIAGIIIGFALQDILKDLVMGTNLVMDDFFSVGDVVKYGNITGKIIYFNIKVTKIKSIDTGAVCTICNRNISEIERMPDFFYLSVPISYETELKKSREVCREICRAAEKNSMVKKCEFLGTDEFCDSLIKYKLCVHCDAESVYRVRRAVLGIIQDIFLENDMSVPYSKLDVNCKIDEGKS